MWWLLVGILFYLMIYTKPLPSIDRIKRIAQAIAKAEGYYVIGSLPNRSNNPGSLRLHGETDTITQFPSVSDGWNALYHQVTIMLNGRSAFYSPKMTIREVAEIYTGGDKPDAWARIVSESLHTDVHTRIGEVA